MTPGYFESVRWPLWLEAVTFAVFASCLAIFVAFREAFRADAQDLLWVWDAIWITPLLVTLAVRLLLGRLDIRVDGDALELRYGPLPLIGKRIALGLIERAEALRYAPIRQFGGWGIRRGRLAGTATAVYSLAGAEGVLLTLSSPVDTAFLRTHKILIGNRRHLELAEHLNRTSRSR